MVFLSAPSDLLAQCFRNFDSNDLGVEDLGKEFCRIHVCICILYNMIMYIYIYICIHTHREGERDREV